MTKTTKTTKAVKSTKAATTKKSTGAEKIVKNVQTEKIEKAAEKTVEKYTIENHREFVATLENIEKVEITGLEMKIYGPKKLTVIQFNEETGHYHVLTVLNKTVAIATTEKELKDAGRNKLILKSAKAVKSYTACHTK